MNHVVCLRGNTDLSVHLPRDLYRKRPLGKIARLQVSRGPQNAIALQRLIYTG